MVAEVARDTQAVAADVESKAAALALLNACVCGGPGRHSAVFRSHLRHDLLALGLTETLTLLRQCGSFF